MAKNTFIELSKEIRTPKTGIITFAEKVCGLPVSKHEGQVRWLQNSDKAINILRPGNRFGKSLIEAVKHLYHHFTKINISGMYNTVDEWMKIKYDTLNFGPAYEQAREILRMARDIAQGEIFIPRDFQAEYGVTNTSLLKDWFIVEDKSEANMLPFLTFESGGSLYGRSYSDMGSAFKMKGLAFVSGDEVADIQELWAFTNNTLLPRLAQFAHASIDYVGTPQPEGFDFMRMIEMAEDDMARSNYATEGMFYHQKGSMLENPFLAKETVENIMKIADPVMRKQIIEGEYAETGDKYFGYERIQNSIDANCKLIDRGYPGRRYLVTADFAGGESYWSDYTVIMVIDYTEEPYRVVYFHRSKGSTMSIPMQYSLVKDIYFNFRNGTSGCRLIIDASALGGKNAMAFLKDCNPIPFESNGQRKGEMLSTLKTAFDGGQSESRRRRIKILPDGGQLDENSDWGLIRFPNIPEMVSELTNYKLDDDKIRTDTVMALGQAIHYLEMRRPKQIKNRMVAFDVLTI